MKHNHPVTSRHRGLLTALFLLSVSLIPARAWADPPPRQEWARLFGTAKDDLPTSIAISRSGQIYAGGYTRPIGGQQNDFLAKINNCAVPEWFHEWSGHHVAGVAVDDCEFVSMAATSFENGTLARVRRLDRCGRCYWDAGLPDIGSANSANGVAVWRSQTYVALKSDIGVHVAQFDPSGSRRWIATLDRDKGFNFGIGDLAVDGDGSAYIICSTDKTATGQPAPGGRDNFLAKFDRDGHECWRRIWGSDAVDIPLDLLLDKHGQVIVFAKIDPVTGPGPQSSSLVVFDGSGTQRSNTAVRPTHLDGAAFDLSGRLYKNEGKGVARYLYEPANATWTRDSWSWGLPNGAGIREELRGIAADPQGNIYLTGYADRDFFFGQPRLGGLDGFVVKLVPTN